MSLPNTGNDALNNQETVRGAYYYNQGQEYFYLDDFPNAIKSFKKSAVVYKNTSAMFALGIMFYRGIGIKHSFSKSLHWYELAAEKGHVPSMNEVGVMYEHGLGCVVNYEKALRWFKKTAKNEDEDGMCNLGVMYHFGLGVEKSYSEAAFWFKKASMKDHLSASNSLAFSLETGRGVERDVVEAFNLYNKVATKGEAFAMINLGRCYEFGVGCEKNEELAKLWYKKALRAASTDHLFQIGTYYYQGSILIKKNFKKALEFFNEALEKGCKSSQQKIEELKNMMIIDKQFPKLSGLRENRKLVDVVFVFQK